MTSTARDILITLKESDEAADYNEALRHLITVMAAHPAATITDQESWDDVPNEVIFAADLAIEIANEEALQAADLFKRQLKQLGVSVISSWGEDYEWEVFLDRGYTRTSSDCLIAGMAAWELTEKSVNV
jgi:hypothetical protein